MTSTREERITRVCFARTPSDDDLAALGERERWLLYRRMVRSRIADMVRAGLPRSARALGEAPFQSLVDDWLAGRAPQSRYIRDVVPECHAFLAGGWAAAQGLSPASIELALYECTRWITAHGESVIAHAPAPFAFERPPVLNPAATLLTLAYPVHRDGAPRQGASGAEAAGPHHLLVYRRQDNHNVGALELTNLERALVDGWRSEPRSPAHETARAVAAQQGAAVDAAFVERLGTLAARLIEGNVLLGSQ